MAVTVTYAVDVIANDFQTNTYEPTNQLSPDVLGLSGGGFVSAYNNASAFDGFIVVNFYDADAGLIGSHDFAAEGPSAAVGQPKLAELADGDVLVVWDDDDDAGAGNANPRASIYTAEGAEVAENIDLFAIDSTTTLGKADVAALHEEGFIVTYESDDEIWFRTYDSAGVQQGSFAAVNTATTGDQYDPQATVLSDGAFAITWTDYGTGTALIKARIFEADGQPRTGEFDCSPGIGNNTFSSIAALRSGGFAVVYTDSGWSEGGVGAGAGITLHIVSASGSVSTGIHVNNTSAPDEAEADVTVLENGFIAVTWTYPFSPTDQDLQCRIFNQAGVAVTGVFSVAASSNDEIGSAVSALGGGKFVASWESEATDGALGSIGSDVIELLRTAAGDGAADAFTGDVLRDEITGGAGNDTLNGGSGADTIDGGDDADLISGGGEHDSLSGGDGNDTIDGGAGNDRIFGVGTLFENPSGGDVLNGGVGNDRIKGSAAGGGDTIDGGVGDDKLDGGVSSDVLVGGDGADTIKGQIANDTIEGGAGSDFLDGGLHQDVIYAASAADIDGSAAGDTLRGASGDDGLFGSAGADHLSAAQGRDTLDGRAGADTIDGGTGRDLLIGGLGADQLTGGADNDVFVYTSAAQSVEGQEDRILDLDGEDRINLSAVDARIGKPGDQAFELVAAFTGKAGELVVVFHAGGAYAGLTTIAGDVNGDGLSDLLITVSGDHSGFTDFFL